MLKNEYLIYSIKNNHILEANWWFSVFSPLDPTMEGSNYIKYENNKFLVLLQGTEYTELTDITDKDVGKPLYLFNTPMEVTPDIISNVTEVLSSTIGRLLSNKILIEFPFKDKIDYINTQFVLEDIESKIVKLLREDTITVQEYLLFTDAANFITGMSRLVNYTASYYNIVPPDDLDVHKHRIKEEYDKKYGEDWVKDRVRCVAYQEEIKKIDEEWLKRDPGYKGYMTKKIKDNARVKQSLMFGAEVGFDKTGKNMAFVESSLLDGLPKDRNKLSAMYNSSRAASYDRGKETQKGGAAAKDILRASSNIKLVDGDCGSKKGLKVTVNKDIATSLTNRFYIENGNIKKIENGKDYIGKTIELRSPCYCISKGTSYCSVCVGKTMADYKTGTPLVLLDISSTLLKLSLKAMHNTQVQLTDITKGFVLK